MKYACLIYGDEAMLQKMSREELGKLAVEYKTFTDGLQKSGQYIASHGLSATNTATTVRVRNGKTMVTDGPFIETKEQLGSIYVVSAKDLNEAIQIASKIPSARFGGIEVRPLWGEG
jgi:hypothetical protein